MTDRYDREARLAGWRVDRLRGSRVVIAGLGALGQPLAQALALAGVGELWLVDPDTLDPTNLSRAPLARPGDVGRPKVDVTADALRRLAPDLRVVARRARLEVAVGLGELATAHLLLGGVDSRHARVALASRRGHVGVPWIDGGTGPWTGEVRVSLDPLAPCVACSFGASGRAAWDPALGCGGAEPEPAAAAAPIAALVASSMALLAVRHLMGMTVEDGLLVVDAARVTVVSERWSRDPGCPFHVPLPPARRVGLDHRATVGALARALGPNLDPLAWEPIRRGAHCRRCGEMAVGFGPATPTPCVSCGGPLQLLTTERLLEAPRDVRLADLGVLPEEILRVRGPGGLGAVALDPSHEVVGPPSS